MRAQNWIFSSLIWVFLACAAMAQSPQFIQQPLARTTTIGGSVAFSVDVSGTPPIELQWHHNGIPLDGQRSETLILNDVLPNFGGIYEVTASNSLGSVTSQPAELVVYDPSAVQTRFGGVDAAVNDVAIVGSMAYLAGNFSHYAPVVGGFAKADATTAGIETSLPRVSGEVREIVSDGAGGWFVAGRFSKVDQIGRTNVVRILPTGEVDLRFRSEINGKVNALAVHGQRLILGGEFSEISGVPCNGLGALDLVTGQLIVEWGTANQTGPVIVNDIVLDGSSLFVGGSFTNLGGLSRTNLAKLSASTGDVDGGWGPAVDQTVSALLIANGRIWCGGDFQRVNGVFRQWVTQLDVMSGAQLGTVPILDGPVRSFAREGNSLFIGGEFANVEGAASDPLIQYDLGGGGLIGWSPNISKIFGAPSVRSIAVENGVVYFGGDFDSVGGQTRSFAASADLVTSAAGNWIPGVDGPVEALFINSGSVLLGGRFHLAGLEMVPKLIALDLNTGARVELFNPQQEQSVQVIAASEQYVFVPRFVGNNLDIVGIDPATGADLPWSVTLNGQVDRLVAHGDTLFIGGPFTTVNGTSRNSIAAVSISTGQLLPFNPSVTHSSETPTVRAIRVAGQSVYLGGFFEMVGAESRPNFAVVDITDGTPSLFSPAPDFDVFGIDVVGESVLVGGWFDEIAGRANPIFAVLDAAARVAANSPLVEGAAVTAIGSGSQFAYAGGEFTAFGEQPRTNLVIFDSVSAEVLPMVTETDASVDVIASTDRAVIVAGGLQRVNGVSVGGFAVMGPEQGLPLITTPVRGLSSPVGGSVALNARYYGPGPFGFQWYHDGYLIGGANMDSLVVQVGAESGGDYSVVVSNPSGVTSNLVATLDVEFPIEVFLDNTLVFSSDDTYIFQPGTNITLTVAPATDYQWRRNGLLLEGETNQSLVIAGHQTNSGLYSVTLPLGGERKDSEPVNLVIRTNDFGLSDTFADRVSLTGTNGCISGNNFNATQESSEPFHADRRGGRSVWCKWVAPGDGIVTFSTLGSALDTLMAAYTGTDVNQLNTLAGDDDSADFRNSQLSIKVEGNLEYSIAIDGFGGQTNFLTLGWQFVASADEVPNFVHEPESQTLQIGTNSVTFEAEVESSDGTTNGIVFEWFTNQISELTRIPNETGRRLTLPAATHLVKTIRVRARIGNRTVRARPAKFEFGPDPRWRTSDRFADRLQRRSQSGLTPAGVSSGEDDNAALIGDLLGQQFVNNENATTDIGEAPVAGTGDGKTLNFPVKATRTGTAVVCVRGIDPGVDPVVSVLEGNSQNSLRLIASDRNGCEDGISAIVAFSVIENNHYTIVVDTENGTEGVMCIDWQMASAPRIIQNPMSLVSITNDVAVFTAEFSGTPLPSGFWHRDGVPLSSEMAGVFIETTNTSRTNTSSTLILSNISALGTFEIDLVVSNVTDFARSPKRFLRVIEPYRILEIRKIDNDTNLEMTIDRRGQTVPSFAVDIFDEIRCDTNGHVQLIGLRSLITNNNPIENRFVITNYNAGLPAAQFMILNFNPHLRRD